jgi:hypothetical protein
MTTTAPEADEAADQELARAVLARAKAALLARKQADVDLLTAALEWAHTRPATRSDEVAGWGDADLYSEGHVLLAGEGAPLVTEFAPLELAASLGWTPDAARSLMADALELAHRLPELWVLVCQLRIPAASARYAAEQTHDLAFEAAAHADRLLARAVGRALLTSRRIRALVDEARLYHDPDRAVADEENALADRKVELSPGNTPATVDVTMVLDPADAEAFDHTVGQVAEVLGRLGDEDPLQVRRARAVGILADPQTALDLIPRRPATPAATLYLHLNESALADIDTFPAAVVGEGTGRLRHHGLTMLTSDLLAMWLQDSTVVVKPVIDLNHPEHHPPVDAHDPPQAMAEYVRLRDPVCVFPGCQRPSRSCDLDHIDAYVDPDDGGPPGQTRPDNLAPLCRRHHRAKTFGGWRYSRYPDGSYHWISPTGCTFTVPSRTWS